MRDDTPEASDHYFSARPRSETRMGIVRAHLRNSFFQFMTASGVFSRTRIDLGTRLLIDSMVLPQEGLVLDMGCGYGAVGIVAAHMNPRLIVHMVDVNERAVWLARRNLELNRVTNAEVRQGYAYTPVGTLAFDCILSNPPVSAGTGIVEEIIREAPEHMKKGGSFQMVVKSKTGGRRFRSVLEETFGSVEILARRSGYRVFVSEKQQAARPLKL